MSNVRGPDCGRRRRERSAASGEGHAAPRLLRGRRSIRQNGRVARAGVAGFAQRDFSSSSLVPPSECGGFAQVTALTAAGYTNAMNGGGFADVAAKM